MFPGRNVCWDNGSANETFFSPLFKAALKYVVVFTSLTWSSELPSSTWRLRTYHIPDVTKQQNFESKQQVWRLCSAHPEKSQVPAPANTLQSNCKALGHSRVVEKGGNGLKQRGFHPGSLTGNMSHVYTWHIFELPQASWPKSSCISLTTCFFLPFQALVTPEVNYHQWHWGTLQASRPDPSQLSHITPVWLVLMLHSPSISLLRG